MLEPLICGEWDGCGVWLQWNPADQEAKTDYEINLRYRKHPRLPWTDWITIVPRQGTKSHWAVIPTWKEGWQAQARVRVQGAPDDGWEIAQEVTFSKCSALFEFKTDKHDQHFQAGTPFHCQVDAAACAYILKEEIEVKAGQVIRTRMEALGHSGYFQLDHPRHFELKPSFGLTIWNVEPSENDVAPTGRDVTDIKAKPIPDPMMMTVGKPDRF
jgi:hypothetical protein